MQIITVAIQRGGTAKTTTTAALAQAAAFTGRHVLAIDLDPQGNLSFTLRADTNRQGSLDFLNGEPARHVVQQTADGVDVIPASWGLSTISSSAGSARRLQAALAPIAGRYDLVIIDTPPTAGELQYNALQAATGLIIPLAADIFGLQGLYQITDTAAQIRKTNRGLTVKGIVFTRHNDRSRLARQMQATITGKAADMGLPCLGAIREGVAIREAQTLQQSLFKYAPNSKPAADYMNLFNKIMEG